MLQKAIQAKRPESHIAPSSPLYLAIDQGGHASRAMVFDTQGAVLSEGHCALQTHRPQNNWVEHDPDALTASVHEAISQALSKLGKDRTQIAAAALATQRSSIVSWNGTTKTALSKVISWQDRRAAEWMTPFQNNAADIRKRTGLFPSPHYGASKLRWCLEHLPKVKTALQSGELVFGPLSSFIIARLTQEGQAWVDPANASRTLLWNINTGDWDPHLLQLFGIPKQALPKTVLSRHAFGHISVSGQRIPLSLVTGDQSAALFQEGIPQKETVYLNIGTGAFLQQIQTTPMEHTDRLLSSIVFEDAEVKYTALEGTVNGAGAALDWFKDHDQLDDLFKKAEPWLETAKHPPIFLNAVGGIGSPFWKPGIKSRFIGEGEHSERFTAVIESIIFLIQANLQEMNQIRKAPKRIIISGGIARLDGLCQRLADLSDLSVIRPEAHEATARGLAFLLSKTHTPWPSTRPSKHFSPKKNQELKKRYRSWQNIMLNTCNKKKTEVH